MINYIPHDVMTRKGIEIILLNAGFIGRGVGNDTHEYHIENKGLTMRINGIIFNSVSYVGFTGHPKKPGETEIAISEYDGDVVWEDVAYIPLSLVYEFRILKFLPVIPI